MKVFFWFQLFVNLEKFQTLLSKKHCKEKKLSEKQKKLSNFSHELDTEGILVTIDSNGLSEEHSKMKTNAAAV